MSYMYPAAIGGRYCTACRINQVKICNTVQRLNLGSYHITIHNGTYGLLRRKELPLRPYKPLFPTRCDYCCLRGLFTLDFLYPVHGSVTHLYLLCRNRRRPIENPPPWQQRRRCRGPTGCGQCLQRTEDPATASGRCSLVRTCPELWLGQALTG